MKILHAVEFYSPSVGGAQEVVRQISRRLAARGHDVTVATTRLKERKTRVIDGVKLEEFAIAGNAVRGIEGEQDRYRDFLLGGDFDVVMSYAAQQWTTDLLLPLVERLPYASVLAPCGFSGLHQPAYAEYFQSLPERLGNFDALVLHSETYQDARFVREAGLRYDLIPNGAGADEFAQALPGFRTNYGIPDDAPILLTVGGHTGLKGHAQLINAFRRARLKDAVLVVIGNTPTGRGCLDTCRARSGWANLRSRDKRVLLLDPPREEVLAAYQAADLFVLASQVECSPLVLFEAMAAHTPFLTVDVGNAAEIASWSGGGVVLPSGKDGRGYTTAGAAVLADGIEALLADRTRLAKLGSAGHAAWRKRFTWERIAQQYEQVYKRAVSAHG
ncbi:MAG: glycosyltransferase family 4 protein [Gaiellaceae bacterium]